MDMQDKEFDELFRSNLDSFEVEPSAQVWPRVEKELNGKSNYRKLLPVLRIAASLLIVLSIGVFLISKKELIKHYQVSNQMRKKTEMVAKATVVKQPALQQAASKNTVVIKTPTVNNMASAILIKRKYSGENPNDAHPANQLAPDNKNNADATLLASSSQLRQDIDRLDVPSNGITSSAQMVNISPDFENGATRLPAMVNAPLAENNTPAVRHKVRSLGDMFNIVIAKVDKRKDKFIEFSDTDDDEYSITGVNLGIIKIKKDK